MNTIKEYHMETKKLSRFSFLILIVAFCHSCKDETAKQNLSSKEKKSMISIDSNIVVTDNGVVFLETILINNIKYRMQTITDYSVNYDVVRLINETDTIEFEKDGLYVTDSIYDINIDNKKDLNVTYQSTNGFVTFAYLFDKASNKLLTIPDTLHNFTSIDKNSFFQIFNNFTFRKFEKYNWSGTNIVLSQTYLVDYSNNLLIYYKIANNDTIEVKEYEIKDAERDIIRKFKY